MWVHRHALGARQVRTCRIKVGVHVWLVLASLSVDWRQNHVPFVALGTINQLRRLSPLVVFHALAVSIYRYLAMLRAALRVRRQRTALQQALHLVRYVLAVPLVRLGQRAAICVSMVTLVHQSCRV